MTIATALKYYNTLEKDEDGHYDYDYDSAIEIFVDYARDGDPEAQYYLGECFYYGRGDERNLNNAASCLTISSENGNSNACCLIATMMHRKELISESSNGVDMMRHIMSIYIRAMELDPQNGIAKYKMAELLFTSILPLIDKNSQQYSDNIKKIFALCSEASVYDIPEAFTLTGHVLISNPQLNANIIARGGPPIINFYLNAAKLGDLNALMVISEIYLKEQKYDEMTWWYWWAVKYDPEYKNTNIIKIIKDDKVLAEIYKNMPFDKTTKYYKIKKDNGYDTRLYDEVHKMWFLTSYYKAILISDYIPYDEKVRIAHALTKIKSSEIKSKPIKKVTYTYSVYTSLFLDATLISNKMNNAIKMYENADFVKKLKDMYTILIYKAVQPLNDIVVLHKKPSNLKSPDTYKKIITECEEFIRETAFI